MKFGLLIFGLTAFFVTNVYHDGKYVQLMKTWKKYYQMAGIAFIGLSAYLFIKKNPADSKNLFKHANEMVKYMPIDKDATDLLMPIIDMTNMTNLSLFNDTKTNLPANQQPQHQQPQPHQQKQQQYQQKQPQYQNLTPQQKRLLNSGNNGGNNNNNTQKPTKRCVSETKKKFVAAAQGWNCGSCKKQLPAWFEVDHKLRLEQGGSNHVDNLVALCRDCHGKKTAFENL